MWTSKTSTTTTTPFTANGNRQMDLSWLSDFAEMNGSVIVFHFSNSEHKFYDLLERKQTPDDYVLMIKIISKISADDYSNTKCLVLHRIHIQSRFWHNISVYLKALPKVRASDKFKNTNFWREPDQFYHDIVNSLEVFLIIFPKQLKTTIMPMFCDLRDSVAGVAVEHRVNLSTNLFLRMESCQLEKLRMKSGHKKDNVSENSLADYSPEIEYKALNVHPKLNDLLGEAPKLELKRDQPYDRFYQYIDRRFRLVREDIFGPLRVDIKKHLRNPKANGTYENMQIYNSVKFTKSTVIGSKIGYVVNINYYPSEKHNTEFDENQLTYGSLVIFTRDKFRTILAGTIIERDLKDTFVVELPDLELGHQIYNHSFMLVECKVLFEAYRHVLSVLQNLEDDQMPFKDYIMQLSNNVKIPSYVIQNPYYVIDFGGHRYRVNVTDEKSWHMLKDVNMDGAQKECFRAALNRELTIIQGPPGTGKSFIGLQIVKTLLNNVTGRGPILILCYTNHALDQFLEDTLKFTKNVVRFGSQSKSSELEAYNISELRRKVKSPLWRQYRSIRKSLLQTEKQIHEKHFQNTNNRIEEFISLQKESASLSAQLERINVLIEKDTLLQANIKIVGMTTSAASRKNFLLQNLNINIVVVEEAAEVPEAHVIASLPNSVKHLIMIGDHLQLRPATANYDLCSKSDFEVSLFERLVLSGVPYNSLRLQHRMRPEIAALITPLIYPHLENHERVLQYPPVKGMSANLYFLTHSRLEGQSQNDKGAMSYHNIYEAEMCVKVACHLVKSGYLAEEITLLTLYNGQLARIQKLISCKPELENLVVKVVDSYQGEENRIVILSLVRSNKQGKVGFLNLPNRVCVALSRAREGLYIVGNMEMLRDSCRIWSEIHKVLKNNNAIGNDWPFIICKNQPEFNLTINNVPERNSAIENSCEEQPESNISPVDLFLEIFFDNLLLFLVLFGKGMFFVGQFIYNIITEPDVNANIELSSHRRATIMNVRRNNNTRKKQMSIGTKPYYTNNLN